MKTENLKQQLSKIKADLDEIMKEMEEQPEQFDFKKALEESGHAYYLDEEGCVLPKNTLNINTMIVAFLQGNTFLTRKAAEKKGECREVTTLLKLNAGDQGWVDWSDGLFKYFIYVDNGILWKANRKNITDKFLKDAVNATYSLFKTTEERNKAISIIGEERIIKALS